MPIRATAGNFTSFAYTPSARAKSSFIKRAVQRAAPDYEPPPDYWFRLRSALVSMISRDNYTNAEVERVLAKSPEKRRDLFRRILSGFVASWPPKAAVPFARPRLAWEVAGLLISCQPHAAVAIAQRRWFLRFLYPPNPVMTPKVVAEYAILRRASDERVSTGLLHVISGRIIVPKFPRHMPEFLEAEASEYIRLWRRHGGPT